MTTIYPDYLWAFKWNNIDNNKLYDTCCDVEKELMKIHEVPKDNKYGCFTTYYHKEYNRGILCKEALTFYSIHSINQFLII